MIQGLRYSELGSSIPEIEPPFAVLLDAGEESLSQDSSLNFQVQALLAAGCQYFVCFGGKSEEVHDRIDDLLVEQDVKGVTTTFHHDESEQDVANFFMTVALPGMIGALIISCKPQKWAKFFGSGG